MPPRSSQKFIGRNRPPRVQIEFDDELYTAEKKKQLPFVMGVMSDLSGKPVKELPPVAERKFLPIDVDNFDEFLKSMTPRVAFNVDNMLTGEGKLPVTMSFESMDDFNPAAIARKVKQLRKLLAARQELSNLIDYMDGRSGAEPLLTMLLADHGLMKLLSEKAAARYAKDEETAVPKDDSVVEE